MSTTDTLRDALVADLTAINGTGIFSTTIGQVSSEPLRADEATLPAASIVPGAGGTSELESLTNFKGLATQEFTVNLMLKSYTPYQDMDNFTDDVRNAIERSTGNVMAVSNIEMAAVTEWGELTIEQTDDGTIHIRPVTVLIRYLYERGSL